MTEDPNPGVDGHAIGDKFAPPEEHAQLLVIGAGRTGLAAATEAARLGVSVVLIDENPVPAALMGMDVPLFYGQRMNAAVQDHGRMVEQLISADPETREAVEAAFDAGVDVRLGIAAWGAFTNGDALAALPASVAGLTDGTRSWLCAFDALILATGARDLVLGFEGAGEPGVMGVRALHSLLARYDAFAGQRLVVLGSGARAIEIATAALDRGLEVAALVDILPQPLAATDALAARGVRIMTGTTILRAETDVTGVRAAIVAPVDDPSLAERIPCDTICLAIGEVPMIELASVAGCRIAFAGERGGHVAVTNADGATSRPGIFCAGDCAGLDTADICAAQGLAAAQAAAAFLHGEPAAAPVLRPATPDDLTPYRLAWMRALAATGDAAAPVCLCEEVSRAELLGVRPPRYLGAGAERNTTHDCHAMLQDGPIDPDQLKRLTRAGMGPCQGRRCREQIAMLVSLASEQPLVAIPLASYRAPVRPLPLSALADTAETAAMRDGWDVWFGIRKQWIPYDAIGTEEEERLLRSTSGLIHT